ncbi:MAG: FAD-dependent oxidoreductase [Luteibacter sp.]|uniref:flavin monoamine oxidase family protein n=1 Tax=Luteibacter sp. TaxID=1886636 RepID=UPI0028066439|nr:FAD-dependent oxidoreductase [Luteibacter sp.]MDQ7995250.1 FAD-dependent oxidoreductase [Luteibacter sp.]
MTRRIGIVGGGVAGLYAAWQLASRDADEVVLLEARDRLGGRVESVSVQDPASSKAARFDLGATWFWPAFQPQLRAVLAELGLSETPQFESGDALVDWSMGEPVRRAAAMPSAPPSMRLEGGMAALCAALEARARASGCATLTGYRVTAISATNDGIMMEAENASGDPTRLEVDHVLLAVPPRLATQSIRFHPELPAAVQKQWQSVGTWMAPHAKYVAVYASPFWRDAGLSGALRSAVGPLGEVHDASPASGMGALFGFLSVGAPERRRAGEDAVKAACRAQLVRAFGPEASRPVAEFLRDWATEPYTATAADQRPGGSHATAAPLPLHDGPWAHRLTAIGSEWSSTMPGYLAGAIEAAHQGVAHLLNATKHPGRPSPWAPGPIA